MEAGQGVGNEVDNTEWGIDDQWEVCIACFVREDV